MTRLPDVWNSEFVAVPGYALYSRVHIKNYDAIISLYRLYKYSTCETTQILLK